MCGVAADECAALAKPVGDEAAGAWTDPGDVVIRIEPGLLRAWDFADDYP